MVGVDFDVDGKIYTLRYGLNALCSLERQTGRKALEIFRTLDGDHLEMQIFRAVVQAGLSQKMPEDAVGDLIDAVGFQKMADLLSQAVRLAFPDAAPGEASAEA